MNKLYVFFWFKEIMAPTMHMGCTTVSYMIHAHSPSFFKQLTAQIQKKK